jgi:predicted NodU family carbamoyl transferase
MSVSTKRTRKSPLARGVYTVRKGIGYLQAGDLQSALREFRSVSASQHSKTTQLVRGVASFYAYNTERFRKEAKKARIGNAHLMETYPGNSGIAWSDVDIAAVLIAPQNRFTTRFLAQFLGRTEEAVRFQRRYAFGLPLNSWVGEKGTKYTRFTQTQKVTKVLGVS